MVADLKDKQLEIIALMNSWVFSRLIAENERAGESLSREMDAVMEAEREQGRSLSPRLLSCLPGTQAPPPLRLLLPSGPRARGIPSFWHFFQEHALTIVAERMRVQLESCVSNIRAALASLSRAVM